MYLKGIEITGFKSFPDKVNIKFTDGISAIVGPNGSGKSNICDAIRWVFGEQSVKTLRGGKMEDVIFCGTQSRKAVGFAQVDLTIDNSSGFLPCDFNEVTITRKYFRSGESEYFINRTGCRLKDVHELFMDTGLGREGYSIIGQGRIAEILSQKSEDRRHIFEEAAGISKYRYKKSESEKRLKSTQENIVRLNDIIMTLSERVEPLKTQSEKAAEFLRLRDRLRELEVSLWLISLNKIKEGTQKAEDDFSLCKEELEKKRESLNRLETALTQVFDAQQQNSMDIDAARAEIENIKLEYTKKNNDIAIMKNNIEHNMQNISRLKKESEFKKSRFDDIDKIIIEKESRLDALNDKKHELEKSLSVLFSEGERISADINNINKEIENFKEGIMTMLHNQSVLKMRLSSLESKNIYLKERNEEITTQADEQKKKNDENIEKLNRLKKELLLIDEKISEVDNGLAGYNKKLEGRNLKINELKAELESLEKEVLDKKTRHKMLNDLQNELDGYQKSVKYIINQSRNGYLKNICGSVASLFSVETKYVMAIEVALLGAVQNIVTNTENDAKLAINLLKEQGQGRATFLPVSSISGVKNIAGGLLSCEGFKGVASDVIEFDKKYQGIFLSLLGRTAIFDNIDNAMAAAKKTGYKTKIVTLDGQIISAGGAMTGGSYNKTAGILSRTSQIRQLDLYINDAGKKTDKLRADFETQNKETADIKYFIDDLKAAQEEYKKRKIEITAQVSYLETAVEQIKQNQAASFDSVKENNLEIENNLEQTKKTNKDIIEIDEKIKSAQNNIKQSNISYIDIETIKKEQDEKITQSRLLLNSAQKDIEAGNLALDEIRAQKNSLLNEDLNYKAEIESLELSNTEILKKIEKSQENLEVLSSTRDNKESRLQLLIAKKISLEVQNTKHSKENKALNEEVLQNEKEYIRLENKVSSMALEKESIINKLWEIYELTLTSAQKYEIKIESINQAQSASANIKNQIQKLGSINIDAIDEYKEVKERLEFLNKQTDDLINAKNELDNIIDGLTRKMKQIFVEQFELINKTFNQTFCELFGGGRASLALADKSDILNCGIDINVSLPGKNIRSISLLSGGEQAFCAIAIIFAILKVRPTPFCVFDEIEAPLDDVNVEKFSRYINTLKQQTQFIVITHRRGTMEGADVLYGVTMQEKGVSKLLAINIAEVEKNIKI